MSIDHRMSFWLGNSYDNLKDTKFKILWILAGASKVDLTGKGLEDFIKSQNFLYFLNDLPEKLTTQQVEEIRRTFYSNHKADTVYTIIREKYKEIRETILHNKGFELEGNLMEVQEFFQEIKTPLVRLDFEDNYNSFYWINSFNDLGLKTEAVGIIQDIYNNFILELEKAIIKRDTHRINILLGNFVQNYSYDLLVSDSRIQTLMYTNFPNLTSRYAILTSIYNHFRELIAQSLIDSGLTSLRNQPQDDSLLYYLAKRFESYEAAPWFYTNVYPLPKPVEG